MLKEITKATLRSILKLKVSEKQSQFVADNATSIAQAHFDKHAWFKAIYADENPVGFVMLYLDHGKADYWVWRFMIDEQFQGKGYGFKAMQEVIDYVSNLANVETLKLSFVPNEGNPAPFYEKLGFVETGEWEDNEKVMAYYFDKRKGTARQVSMEEQA